MTTYSKTTRTSRPLGIDVAKRELVLATYDHALLATVTNDKKGFAKILKAIKKHNLDLVVLEATGGYHTAVVQYLQEQQVDTAIVNPKRVRDYAKSHGKLEKTDAIDARVIASFAASRDLRIASKVGGNELLRCELVVRRNQLGKLRTAETNRLEHATEAPIKKSITTVVKLLDKEIESIDQLSELISYCPETAQKDKVMQSVPGVGQKTSHALLAQLPEIGTLSSRQIAKLSGLAPLSDDSGTLRGIRITGKGRKQPRTTLYMAALVATRFNPIIKTFYQRLLSKGKPKKVALVAAMRKLLIMLNAMVKKNQLWQPDIAKNT